MAERKTAPKTGKVTKVDAPAVAKKPTGRGKGKSNPEAVERRPAAVQAPAAAPKRGAKKGAAKATPPSPGKPESGAAAPGVDRMRMVAEAAYYRAERRGFAGGWEEQDWLEAEAEIDRLMGK